jgi:hypothetical protein
MSNDASPQDPAGHDAQRGLEHRALRNVRGLVERMEADEDAKRRSQKWVLAGLAAIVVVVGAIVAFTVGGKRSDGQEITVAPVPKAPAR